VAIFGIYGIAFIIYGLLNGEFIYVILGIIPTIFVVLLILYFMFALKKEENEAKEQ